MGEARYRGRRGRMISAETESETDISVDKGGFFSVWFAEGDDEELLPDETREDSFSSRSEDTDSIAEEYPYARNRRQARDIESEDDLEESDDDDESLVDFDREMRVRHAQACKYMRAGKFEKALSQFENILASMLERYGPSHHRVGAALHNVGIANLRAGRLNDAHEAIVEAVRVRKLTLGADSAKVADSLVEFGIILLSLKEYDESHKAFEEALRMREVEVQDVVLPDDVKECRLKVAKVLNNIGCVNFEQEILPDAKEAFEKAISIQKKALGSSLPFLYTIDPTSKPGFLTMASTMCNLGYINLKNESYSEAISILNESLKTQKTLLGAENKLVLSTLNNLGYAYTMNNAYDKALKTYNQLLASQEKLYGETEAQCAATLKKIIYVQLHLENYDKAMEILCRLEDIQLDHFGKDHEEIEQTRNIMGQVNYQTLKYPTGEWLLCGAGDLDTVNAEAFRPVQPVNGSKMSGHRVTCA